MAYGWAGTVTEFLAKNPAAVAHQLAERHEISYVVRSSSDQVTAWQAELQWLSAALHSLPESRQWGLILEYELPFEGGRRPDVILLASNRVVVVEFKEALAPTQAHIDQVQAYARDLEEYHSECRGRLVMPVLMLPNGGDRNELFEGTPIVGPTALPSALRASKPDGQQIDLDRWLNGTYAPLPTLTAAARTIFRDEPLPAIKRAESAGIPQLLTWLHGLVRDAAERGEHHLVLITGVPGSGKTLVGLQFVYEPASGQEPEAYFLSGNGPLVDVLQDALRSKVFVHSMHNFILEYGIRARGLPGPHVFVFDEAQRAWDAEYMTKKKAHARSEPEILMDIASRLPGWGVVIGLVGEGQEIYLGEEAGLDQWRTAVVKASAEFQVHTPPELAGTFAGLAVTASEQLNLSVTLRTHRAEHAHEWVAALMAGDVGTAGTVAVDLRSEGYDLYVTTDRVRCRRYLDERYADAPEKRYGLLASAKAKNLRDIGIDNELRWLRSLAPKWFNAAPADPKSCCNLSMPMTEFQVQGLELDMPVICWGDDLGWEGRWVAYRKTLSARDSRQLRINSYRVLLSRGRDGAIAYVPDTLRAGQQEAIVDLLRAAGVRDLPGTWS